MGMPENIRIYREKNGMLQSELGKKLNVSAQAISKWELGKAEPDSGNIAKMCDMFDVTADELIGRISAEQARALKDSFGLLMDEKRILQLYRELTDEGKAKVFEYLLLLRHEYKI